MLDHNWLRSAKINFSFAVSLHLSKTNSSGLIMLRKTQLAAIELNFPVPLSNDDSKRGEQIRADFVWESHLRMCNSIMDDARSPWDFIYLSSCPKSYYLSGCSLSMLTLNASKFNDRMLTFLRNSRTCALSANYIKKYASALGWLQVKQDSEIDLGTSNFAQELFQEI